MIEAIAALFSAVSAFFGFRSRKDAENTGKLEQRNDDLSATVAVEKREEAAAVNAPTDKDDLERALRNGEA